jgi:hypothetical protein
MAPMLPSQLRPCTPIARSSGLCTNGRHVASFMLPSIGIQFTVSVLSHSAKLAKLLARRIRGGDATPDTGFRAYLTVSPPNTLQAQVTPNGSIRELMHLARRASESQLRFTLFSPSRYAAPIVKLREHQINRGDSWIRFRALNQLVRSSTDTTHPIDPALNRLVHP